jgi:hypothetical protein
MEQQEVLMRAILRTFVSIAPVVLAVLAASCSSYDTETAGRSLSLEAGTALRVTPVTALSPAIQEPGARFSATLAEPLRSGEEVIAQTGATVVGEVVDAQRGDSPGEESFLELELKEIVIDNGQSIAIETDPVQYTPPRTEMGEAQPGQPDEAPPMTPAPQEETVVTFRLAETVEVPLVAASVPAG